MDNAQLEFVRNIIGRWNQENYPKFYKPYREGDFVFIYGDCTGIVIYPYVDYLGYTWLSEDDGFYYLSEQNPNKAVFWMKTDIKCLEVALKYLEENATPMYYIGREGNPDAQCGWQLPWKN